MKKSVKIFWRLFFIGVASFLAILLMANYGIFGTMPSIEELENPTIAQASEVYADDGTLMGKYYLPSGNRSVVRYKDISPNVINALVATEDKRYYEHSGIDIIGTMRAVSSGGSKGGGSTITQQLALALFGERATNPFLRVMQKLREWIIAVKLERNFTKEEILALYLNAVSYPDNVFGIRNASKTFFQKEPGQLNVGEAALLVGSINGPGIYNPRRNPKASMDRRNIVLGRMAENGNISAAEANKLQAQPIKLNYKKPSEDVGYAPYFRETLRDELKKIIKDQNLTKPDGSLYNIYNDGLKIYTTINPEMQIYAEEAVTQQAPKLYKNVIRQGFIKSGAVWKTHENVLENAMKASERWKTLAEDGLSDKEIKANFKEKVSMRVFAWNADRSKDTVMSPYDSIKYHRLFTQVGFMAMDPVTGEVKAWVGGIDFKTFKYDHANIGTKRQVGSTIKPLLYGEAVEELNFTPETPVQNTAQYFPGYGLVPAGGQCGGGSMTMANALAWSKNCATAYIMKQVTPVRFTDFLKRVGVPTKVSPFPSIALGSCDLSLFEMMWAYTIFGGRGFSTKPYFISRIEDRNGNVIKRFDYSVNRKEAISEATAYIMSRMMQGAVDKGTAKGLRARLGAAEMAGKTGTTNDNSDAWFMGFVPQLLAGVWTGSDDRFIRNEGAGGFGNDAARPIWEYFFKKVYENKSLGINKDEKFVEPPTLSNDIVSADPSLFVADEAGSAPTAAGEDVGVGTEEEYMQNNDEYIGPESAPLPDDPNKKLKKDTAAKAISKEKTVAPVEEAPKKKGIFNKLFGKKEKAKDKEKPKEGN
ncbi:MAG TPA: transglycosylase domain-containing protein [Niabella sp.]|nr:transglycosylase domain-containing protein [Niabella sp.]HOZ97657.1 transglycosylase domain-containing protein [Niabella sp.]HQW13963.1 transglycosylase domain-containing protein [Niabella sp.]HQX19494.1 transglycosylase domain-containing protein [Niabella sp.]HQX41455.1 transglycosylase domain-containing protein [Niabella sp.]